MLISLVKQYIQNFLYWKKNCTSGRPHPPTTFYRHHVVQFLRFEGHLIRAIITPTKCLGFYPSRLSSLPVLQQHQLLCRFHTSTVDSATRRPHNKLTSLLQMSAVNMPRSAPALPTSRNASDTCPHRTIIKIVTKEWRTIRRRLLHSTIIAHISSLIAHHH